jgi:hypothetical protein
MDFKPVIEREEFNQSEDELGVEREEFARLIGQVKAAIEELQGSITGPAPKLSDMTRTEQLIEILEGLRVDLEETLKLV